MSTRLTEPHLINAYFCLKKGDFFHRRIPLALVVVIYFCKVVLLKYRYYLLDVNINLVQVWLLQLFFYQYLMEGTDPNVNEIKSILKTDTKQFSRRGAAYKVLSLRFGSHRYFLSTGGIKVKKIAQSQI